MPSRSSYAGPLLVGALTVAVLGIVLCLVLDPPSAASAEHGLSWFGTHRRTLLPFAITLFALATASWTAAGLLDGPAWRATALRVIGVLVPPILLTPYTVSRWVDIIHDTLAGLCFFGQFALALAWGLQRGAAAVARALAALHVVGDLVALRALIDPHGNMLAGELLALAGFLPLLIVVTRPAREQSLART